MYEQAINELEATDSREASVPFSMIARRLYAWHRGVGGAVRSRPRLLVLRRQYSEQERLKEWDWREISSVYVTAREICDLALAQSKGTEDGDHYQLLMYTEDSASCSASLSFDVIKEIADLAGQFERQYLDLLSELVAIPDVKSDRTGVGTRGVFGRMLRCDLAREFPLLTTKKVHMRSIVTELAWILGGRTDVRWLQERKCTIWDEWATAEQTTKHGRAAGDLGPVYGFQWRHFGKMYPSPWLSATGPGKGFDQIQWLIDEIGKNPFSRRLLVTAWNPSDAQVVTLPPCHWAFQVQITPDDKLNLMAQMRSCDVLLGLPFNMASYAILARFLGHLTGKKPGELIMTIGDTHLYRNHLEQARMQLEREPRRPPQVVLHLPPRIDNGVILPLGSAIDHLEPANVEVLGYDPHPAIAAPVAV